MAVPRLLPQRALLSMKIALCELQERLLDDYDDTLIPYTIDDVQRAIEWVEYEFKRRDRQGHHR
jgi:hypothetical protein